MVTSRAAPYKCTQGVAPYHRYVIGSGEQVPISRETHFSLAVTRGALAAYPDPVAQHH